MEHETPYIVYLSESAHKERELRQFGSERSARTYARRASKQQQGICVVRGPIEGDEHRQTFVLAIFDHGEEIEDCDHS
jgi:hypothetical protein